MQKLFKNLNEDEDELGTTEKNLLTRVMASLILQLAVVVTRMMTVMKMDQFHQDLKGGHL